MNNQRKFAALWVVGVLSLGVLLAACGSDTGATSGTGTGTTGDSAARQQFLAERSGTPDPNATPLPGAAGGTGRFGGNRAPGVFGTVKSIDGNKITITSMIDNTDHVVQASDTTRISKEAQGTSADNKVGETVIAIGATEGDTVTAQRVQIGGGFGGFGGRGGGFPGVGGQGVFTGTRAFPSGTPPAGFVPGDGTGFPNASGTPGAGGNRGNFGGAGGSFVNGTVEKVEGDVVTVKAADGTESTFTLTADTSILTQVTLTISDIAVGDSVTATGQQNGDLFDATTIQLVENVPVQQPPAP